MRDADWTTAQLDGFQLAAQSLKLYRRAELVNDADGATLIEDLYVDPLPNDHVLKTLLKGNTTFLIGRKGTGKSTIFSRAQHELRKNDKYMTAYIDIKTVYEQSQIDPEMFRRADDKTILTESAAQHLQLYKSFLKSVLAALKSELVKRADTSSFLAKVRELFSGKVNILMEGLNNLIDDADEEQFISIAGLRLVDVDAKQSDSAESSAEVSGRAQSSGLATISAQAGRKRSSAHDEGRQYAEAFMRTFNLKEFITRLRATVNEAGIERLYLFIDDFSELPADAMALVVDALLAPLNNWSDELVKFKIAAYPGRIYFGAIDKAKIDEVYLDLYSMYGNTEVSAMEEKAIDFTQRLISKRIQHFAKLPAEAFLRSDRSDLWRLLFYATMGNPRIIGYLLYFMYESELLYGRTIGAKAISDAAQRYYETKVESYFRINKFLHESFDERSSIYSLKELLEAIVTRARELRSHESEVIRRIRGVPPRSHFHVALPYEGLLATLELNFFLTKYYEMSDRDAQKVAVYALNYGLCQKYNLSFGRPTEARELRLYFVERIFDYTPIIQHYIKRHQEIICDNCLHKVPLDQLEALRVFHMLCPACRAGTCRVVNLSRKYESLLGEVDANLLLPTTELGILQTLHDERVPLFAQTIAAELDCSYQLIGRRGKHLYQRGLVDRAENDQGRRVFSILPIAETTYFATEQDENLDVERDADS